MVARITVLDNHNLVTIKDIPECWLYEPAVSIEWTIKYLGCTHLQAVSRSEDKANTCGEQKSKVSAQTLLTVRITVKITIRI